jgi:cell division transport system permease protein
MRRWLCDHRDAAASALSQFARAPFASMLAVCTLAIALALPLAAWLVVESLAQVVAKFDAEARVTIFLHRGVGVPERRAVEASLKGRREFKSLRTITKEEALADLQSMEGMRDLLAGLPGNPLPDAFVATPVDSSRRAIQALREELRRLPGVESIQVDSDWVDRLEALVRTGRLIAGGLAAMLAFAVIAVSFSTIRLQVLTRARELELADLLGATRTWLARPFLHFGALQGLCSGVLAAGFVALLALVMDRGLADLPATANLGIRWIEPLPKLALTAVAISTALGWSGAWISLREHFRPSR